MNPTLQEAFDMTARHLLKTGVPSMKGSACAYSGTGCALRPFIPDEETAEIWDEFGSLLDLIFAIEDGDDEDRLKIPDFIANNMEFYQELQDAHDETAMRTKSDPEAWLAKWKNRMRAIAESYRLDAAILDQDNG